MTAFDQTDGRHPGRFDGIPGLVWYAKSTPTLGADLKLGDWLDTLDHRGARMIYGIFAGPAPAGGHTPTVEHLRGLRRTDIGSGWLTVMVAGGETETIRADVVYDVVDPDSQVQPDGSSL